MAWPGSSDKKHAAWSRYRDYGKNRSYTWDDAGVFVFVCLGRVIAEGLLCFLPADTDGGLGFPSHAAFSALARASAFTASTAVCLARAVRATCCKSRVSVPLSEWHEATGTSSSELSGATCILQTRACFCGWGRATMRARVFFLFSRARSLSFSRARAGLQLHNARDGLDFRW
jgi:hypothetical protein